MHVGFIYNIATDELLREYAEMTLKDADSQYTIDAVTEALQAGGHTVTGYNADRDLPAKLVHAEFDIAFNIATGVFGETRQSHVPAMLEYLQIPHTGSGVLAEALCHHKPQMKMILAAQGVRTPPFQVFRTGTEALDPALRFPLIVKLTSEGGSMGLTYDSVVDNEAALRTQLRRVLGQYERTVIVEEYIEGREFTVAVLGNNPAYALPVAELHFFGAKRIRLDEPDAPMFAQLKEATGDPTLTYEPMESETRAPADLPPDVAAQVAQVAIDAYRALGCLDWARCDLRMNDAGEIFVLEMNLEPGIAPDYALPKTAYAAGWTFNDLVNRILDHAIERYPALKIKHVNS